MSILIKGMEMPKSCAFCLCARVVDGSCRITGYNPTISEWYEDGVKDCPLVEIPPHGRLIDADALVAKCKDEKGNYYSHDAAVIGESLELSPTIIEAEGVDK